MRLVLLILLGWSGATLAATVSIEVKVGERVQDWCKRLEARNILTCASVLYLGATERYPGHPLVVDPPSSSPPTQDSHQSKNPFEGHRFEGLLPPGHFEIANLDLASAAPEQPAGLEGGRGLANARVVVTFLLERGAERLRGMPPGHGLSQREQIILASIIEKEAVANTDYKKIAAVFYNRIDEGDKLGSCPTVEYALGYHRPFLLYKDLDAVSQSPSNLYENAGLPPTPICFFSDAALDAVKDPLEDDSIYFFVFDWTTGRLNFESSADYDKHRENAARAKENFRAKYGDIRKLSRDKFYEQ